MGKASQTCSWQCFPLGLRVVSCETAVKVFFGWFKINLSPCTMLPHSKAKVTFKNCNSYRFALDGSLQGIYQVSCDAYQVMVICLQQQHNNDSLHEKEKHFHVKYFWCIYSFSLQPMSDFKISINLLKQLKFDEKKHRTVYDKTPQFNV